MDYERRSFCVVSWSDLVLKCARPKRKIRAVVRTDDPLASGPFEEALDEFFDDLTKRIAIKTLSILGETPLVYLGSVLQRVGDVILECSKIGYVQSILDAARMAQCKPVRTWGREQTSQPQERKTHSAQSSAHCADDVAARYNTQSHAEFDRRPRNPRNADTKNVKHLLRYTRGIMDSDQSSAIAFGTRRGPGRLTSGGVAPTARWRWTDQNRESERHQELAGRWNEVPA